MKLVSSTKTRRLRIEYEDLKSKKSHAKEMKEKGFHCINVHNKPLELIYERTDKDNHSWF